MVSNTSKTYNKRISRGIFTQFFTWIFPALNILEKWQLLHLINPIFVKVVRLYQKWISPHKGFACAHRKLHQTSSGSEFFALNLPHYGVPRAISKQIERFQDCKEARHMLQVQNAQLSHLNLGSPLASQAQRKKRKNQKKIQTCCDDEPISCCDFDCSDLDCDCG